MELNKVSFASTKNRGLTPDLKMVKDYLADNVENISFSYLSVNENAENEWVKTGNKDIKKKYCSDLGHVVCVDASIPTKLAKTAKEGNKILISVPYDYQFKTMNQAGKSRTVKKNTFKGFTHVIAGSPFGKELFEKCYNIPNGQIIDNICNPVAWAINNEQEINEKRGVFEEYFPYIKGKKILSILLTGSLGGKDKNPYEKFDWKILLENLGDEWFVFTNNENVLENAVHLKSQYCKKIGFVNKMLDSRDLMYFSDCIITNSGMYASYFSSKKKPVYCVEYTENSFETYMKKNYPTLFIKDLNNVCNMPVDTFTKDNEAFSKKFSYDASANPCEKILEVLNNN